MRCGHRTFNQAVTNFDPFHSLLVALSTMLARLELQHLAASARQWVRGGEETSLGECILVTHSDSSGPSTTCRSGLRSSDKLKRSVGCAVASG